MIKHAIHYIRLGIDFVLDPFQTKTIIEWVTLLTFLYVFIYLGYVSYLGKIFIWFSLIMFVSLIIVFFKPKILQKSIFWGGLFCVLGVWLYQNNVLVDNHIFLSWFWILNLAILFSYPASRQHDLIQQTSSLFVGFVFILADVQRVFFNNFLSSNYFYGVLLTDDRFKFIGWMFDFYQEKIAKANQELIALAKSGRAERVVLNSGPEFLKIVAQVMTYFTFGVELVLGSVSLWFFRKEHYIKHVVFIVFSLSVYILVPIKGFSMILTLMMMSQCKSANTPLFKGYFLWFFYNLFSVSRWFL